jgi:hypothetical protein
MAPKVDSGATHTEDRLGGQVLMLKLGISTDLEIHLYPDSAARIAAATVLDRSQFVDGLANQTIRRERTLIESANLIGLLTSINGHKRERVSNAIESGPPQAASR